VYIIVVWRVPFRPRYALKKRFIPIVIHHIIAW